MEDPKQQARPIIDLLLQFMGGQRPQWGTQVAQDIEFVNNVQWSEEEAQAVEDTNAPALAVNEIKVSRDRVIGQITKNSPRWIATATEDSDATISSYISDLMSWIWDKSKGNMHFRKAAESFEDTGMFVLMTYVDPNGDMGKGEIKLCWVDPERIFLDPRCSYRDIDDSSDVFVVDIYSKDKILTFYPDFNFSNAEQFKGDLKIYGSGAIRQGQVFNPGFLGVKEYYRVIDHYKKIKVNRLRIYDPNGIFERVMTEDEYQEWAAKPAIIQTKTSGEQVVIDEDEVKQIQSMVRAYGNTFHFMSDGSVMSGTDNHPAEVGPDGSYITPIPNSTVMITQTNMFGLLKDGYLKAATVLVDRIQRDLIIGEKLYQTMTMPISRYPFAVTMLHHTGNPYCYGDARLAKPLQELINKTHSLIIKYNINISAVQAFVPLGTDTEALKKNFGKAGVNFHEIDFSEGAPVFVQLQQMANEFYVQLDRHKMHIQRLYGAYDFQDGMVDTPPQTRGGTLALYEAGMSRTEAKLQLIEEALNDLGYVVAEMIPYVYDKRKVIRIIAPNNKVKEKITFNEQQADKIVNDLTVNKYDIKMISGSTLPSNRWARHEAYLRMWELGVMKNPDPILRTTDFPDIDDIIADEDRLNQATQIINQLQDNLKQLEGDMQTKDRELDTANKMVSKAKFDSALKGIEAQLQAWLQLGKGRINDQVKQTIKALSEGATVTTSRDEQKD